MSKDVPALYNSKFCFCVVNFFCYKTVNLQLFEMSVFNMLKSKYGIFFTILVSSFVQVHLQMFVEKDRY